MQYPNWLAKRLFRRDVQTVAKLFGFSHLPEVRYALSQANYVVLNRRQDETLLQLSPEWRVERTGWPFTLRVHITGRPFELKPWRVARYHIKALDSLVDLMCIDPSGTHLYSGGQELVVFTGAKLTPGRHRDSAYQLTALIVREFTGVTLDAEQVTSEIGQIRLMQEGPAWKVSYDELTRVD